MKSTSVYYTVARNECHWIFISIEYCCCYFFLSQSVSVSSVGFQFILVSIFHVLFMLCSWLLQKRCDCWETRPQQRFCLYIGLRLIALNARECPKQLAIQKRRNQKKIFGFGNNMWSGMRFVRHQYHCFICTSIFTLRTSLFCFGFGFCFCCFGFSFAFFFRFFVCLCVFIHEALYFDKPNTFKLRWHFRCGQCLITMGILCEHKKTLIPYNHHHHHHHLEIGHNVIRGIWIWLSKYTKPQFRSEKVWIRWFSLH